MELEREEVVARFSTIATVTYPIRTRPQSLGRQKRLLERDVGSKLDGTSKR